jgi:hypothetical protein
MGYRQSLLTDDGLVFTSQARHGVVGHLEMVLLPLGIAAAYKDWRVVMLVAGLDIGIVGLDGSPLRHLALDPTKDYQPIGG